MKQLSGLDATFLYMEAGGSQFGHVSSLSIYEPPDRPGYDPLAEWRAAIEKRLHLLEPLRRRLVQVPMNLDHPFWIEDPNFDLDFHVRHTAVPPPGSDEQLSEIISRIIGRPLDRTRPLWETYVIEGLPEGRYGILTKVHHATIDGASGAELLTMMLDQSPEGDEIPPPTEEWKPERVPSDFEVLQRAALSLARKPARGILLTARTIREVGKATSNPTIVAAANQIRGSLRGPLGAVLNIGRNRDTEPDTPPIALPSLGAPKTPFNGTITPHRRFAYRSTSLDAVKAVKTALGATVNDVVMAVCAGGLRTYLDKKGALPEQPLVAMVPVSIRTGEETEKWTNRVSAIICNLPTNVDDPIERVRAVHESMVTSKQLFDAIPASSLTEFASFPPPAVFTRAMRMATRFQLGNRGQPVNVTISNVPGPRQPLYSAGSRLLHYYPVSTIAEGQGLNITVQSYLNTLDFGLVSCRELVPDVWDLTDMIVEDLELLCKAAGVDVPVTLVD
jgi:WS/DGAT/MGAT family acyltransferase